MTSSNKFRAVSGRPRLTFRALCGRLECTVQRHKFNEESLSIVTKVCGHATVARAVPSGCSDSQLEAMVHATRMTSSNEYEPSPDVSSLQFEHSLDAFSLRSDVTNSIKSLSLY